MNVDLTPAQWEGAAIRLLFPGPDIVEVNVTVGPADFSFDTVWLVQEVPPRWTCSDEDYGCEAEILTVESGWKYEAMVYDQKGNKYLFANYNGVDPEEEPTDLGKEGDGNVLTYKDPAVFKSQLMELQREVPVSDLLAAQPPSALDASFTDLYGLPQDPNSRSFKTSTDNSTASTSGKRAWTLTQTAANVEDSSKKPRTNAYLDDSSAAPGSQGSSVVSSPNGSASGTPPDSRDPLSDSDTDK